MFGCRNLKCVGFDAISDYVSLFNSNFRTDKTGLGFLKLKWGGTTAKLTTMDDNHNRCTHNPLSFLTKGSQVEVSSGEDCFTGAWYVATVIHPPPPISSPNHHPGNHLVYVEYHNLISGDGSSTPLREYANISYVRPSPPSDTNSPNFQLNDLVDAFCRDAWWTGVITTVIDDSNFVVTFQNPTDEVQFHCSGLRIHRKWVDGRWFQPQKQGSAGLMFTVGRKVEVSFEKESLRDCWVPATILKNSDDNTFLVEYQQQGTGDEVILHKVTVDYLHIRPSPPHLRDKNFVVLEKVDAYYDFGWWSGVITKELADNRYIVFFKHMENEREFIYSRVRPHMEWKGGKWFNASQGDMDGRTSHSLIDLQIEQTTPSIDKQSSVATSSMKRTTQKNLDSNDKGSPPSKELQDEIVNDDLSKKTNRSSVGQSEDFDCEIRGMTDQAFAKIENLSHRKKVSLKLTTDSSRKKRGKLSDELKSLQASDEGSRVDSMKSRTQEIEGKKDITNDLAFPVVMGLQCNGMTVSQANTLQKLSIEKSPNVAESDTRRVSVPSSPLSVAEKEGREGDAASVAPKRKRGRPPKLQALSTKTPFTFKNQNGGVVPSAPFVVEGGPNKEVGLTTSLVTKSLKENQGPVKKQPGIQNASLSNDKLPNGTGQDLDIPLDQGTKKYSTKKGKRKTISVNTESPSQDSQDASKVKKVGSLGKVSATRNPEASAGKSVSPITVNASEGTVEQSSKISSEDLPFVRTTSLWKAIESMEAFRMLPQKPHFRPLLEGVKQSAREGLAIGTMVTFSTIVDKTRGMRSDDPRSTIEDCLETLAELENNGFDVKVIRDRLTRLLLMKDKQEELVERSKCFFEKIEEHNVQGKTDDEEIEAIDRQKRELEEKRKQLVLKKEKKKSEIDVMEALNEEIEQEMRGVGAEFDGLATAPL
ncbi:hypothetical protein L1987_76770 [Smallanthus sonchifolius]|uniref:Uncharacterized protein n=1 Tax=Smallanthus sonchifolius TaxID=185202 RepID=A0ACB8Z8D2_9ASTR|nr:hypothetical protein L1987_76770 [Smallanthus sonchifolius]